MNAGPIPGRPEDMGALIMELHTTADDAPMQMISAARLAYYRQLEAELMALKCGQAAQEEKNSTDIRQPSNIQCC